MIKTGKDYPKKKRSALNTTPEASQRTGPDVPSTRRRFLNRLWLLLVAVGVVEFAVMLTYYFRPRKPQADPSNTDALLMAGKVADFKPASVTAYPQGKFYLVRLADGGFLALSRQCTHLGCTVPWDGDAGHFACPCHASAFDIHGDVLSAPAPRPLDLFPVVIEDGVVMVDTTKLIRRSRFEASQAVRA